MPKSNYHYPSPASLSKHTDFDETWRDLPDFLAKSTLTGDFDQGMFGDLIESYGGELKGRTHPALNYIAMWKFTNPGDVVWEPMAAKGTVIDIADFLERKIIATDVYPQHPRIEQADAMTWNPGPDSVDLVFMAPSGFHISNYKDTYSSTDDYMTSMRKVLRNVDVALKPGHVMCICAVDVKMEDELVPVEYLVHQLFQEFNAEAIENDGLPYRMLGRVKCDYYVGSKKRHYFNYKKYSLLKFNQFELNCDNALFYQKAAR